MNRFRSSIIALFLALFTLTFNPSFAQKGATANSIQTQKDSLRTLIKKAFPGAIIKTLEVEKPYLVKFEVMISQKVNHQDPKSEVFKQLIYVSHRGFDCPNVLVTEGYTADYAEDPAHNEELCKVLKANLIFVEHRYFGKSKPSSMDWKHLTIKQAAADHHTIVNGFKKIYPNKWVATGISKGGSTALYLKALYPKDVDAVVAYVAPLTNAQEDMRPIDFIIHKAGSDNDRKIIADYQQMMFEHFDQLLPLFEEFAKSYQLTFPMGNATTLEYLILEYPFSHWQWGVPIEKVPTRKDDNVALLKHLIEIVDPAGFSETGSERYTSYYYQAYSEVGYYNYNAYIPMFKAYLRLKSYSNNLLIPKGATAVYHPESHQEILNILNTTGAHILQIQGGLDPWHQSAWIPKNQQELPVFVLPNGNHATRIANFDNETKRKIFDTLEKWLNMKVNRI